ncbi:hypothetical protein A3K69_07035 [Candidatus Bathyarchaeota archaeon RBG_16_57_9]|nr:MAG: hypothetical protein A3K69_07035 [Candidatus Bathyarchaeota archaeon RBG_16_57_9]
MAWLRELKADPTAWLLEPSNPSVRYWTLLDVLNREPYDTDIVKARESIMASEPVKAILAAQEPSGHWCEASDMYLPTYRATNHQLLILAELGASRTPAIERAVEHLYRFQRLSGHFLTELPKTEKGQASVMKDRCCIDGDVLHYLIHFGYLNDPRTGRLLDFILGYHDTENAGWKCRAYPINRDGVFPVNCYMGATKVLKALSIMPERSRTPEIRALIRREVENILENGIYRYLRNPDGSRKDKTGWKRFGFPLFYQSDALEVLDTLTRLGVRDVRMAGAIELVKAAQQDDGYWQLSNTFNGKMWVDIEEKGRPSKWVTLRAVRVLRRFRG